jgi:hypothetical protein
MTNILDETCPVVVEPALVVEPVKVPRDRASHSGGPSRMQSPHCNNDGQKDTSIPYCSNTSKHCWFHWHVVHTTRKQRRHGLDILPQTNTLHGALQ